MDLTPDDLLKVDALAMAMLNYQVAQADCDACYDRCEISPDYWCRDEVDARREAAREFGERLAEFVDSRIIAIVREHVISQKGLEKP